MYRLVRALGFRLGPERAHALALRAHRAAGRLRRKTHQEPIRVMGIDFPNRVGLAAGYDKDAVAWRGLAAVGFGHVEVGTVTPLPQPGNRRPRVFRLVEDRALINRMGFPSRGVAALERRIVRRTGRTVLGVSIGPNRFDDRTAAVADYEHLAVRLAPLADYLAVNVSSPNTPGLRVFESPSDLKSLLGRIAAAVAPADPTPLVVKLSPDISPEEIDGVVAAAEEGGAAGIIATNTTLSRPALEGRRADEPGGLSGAPLGPIALKVLERVRAVTPLPLIASGGIMSAEDARRRFDAGASLVQLYTGFVYEGPRLVREIARMGSSP